MKNNLDKNLSLIQQIIYRFKNLATGFCYLKFSDNTGLQKLAKKINLLYDCN